MDRRTKWRKIPENAAGVSKDGCPVCICAGGASPPSAVRDDDRGHDDQQRLKIKVVGVWTVLGTERIALVLVSRDFNCLGFCFISL